MRVLITGSSGHFGEALARELTSLGVDHLCIDLVPSAFTHRVGSISDRAFVREAVKDIDFIVHAATLHKPHVATHSKQNFVNTNITGTLNLLEEAVSNRVGGFVFTSTTSTFGDALTPKPGEPAVWIDEEVRPVPKNIYGVTKTSAEDLCQLFHRDHRLPCLILKTSRFFPEEDDNQALRDAFEDINIKAVELLYRRVDVEDVVSAHLLAMERAGEIGFGKFIVSATTPFRPEHLRLLNTDAAAVLREIRPEFECLFSDKGWKMFHQIDRVYDNGKARRELGWMPRYDFDHVLRCLEEDRDFRSSLSLAVGSKRSHK